MSKLIIEAGRADRQYWHDLWRYRELFYFLAWRDFLVRYKQTVVGVLWSLLKPLLTMVVLTIVFGRFGKMPSGGVPYPLLVLCGMLPWQFFSNALSESGSSLVNNSNLISKIYFPRLIVPASSIITSLVDFAISGCILAALLFWYGVTPPAQVVLLPLFILLGLGAAFGAGVWIAALMVEYRDFRAIVPFIIQFGLYISPVGFQSNIVPESFHLLFSLNPMVGVIDGFRWCVLGGDHVVNWPDLTISAIIVVSLVTSGIWYFRKTEKTFSDVI